MAMWAALNVSNLEQYMGSSDGSRRPAGRTPPALLGPCNAACASAYWARFGVHADPGPTCGVPGCS